MELAQVPTRLVGAMPDLAARKSPSCREEFSQFCACHRRVGSRKTALRWDAFTNGIWRINSQTSHMKRKTISLFGVLIAAAGFIVSAGTARATIVDLTTGPDASGEINGALFFATQQQPSGTGD